MFRIKRIICLVNYILIFLFIFYNFSYNSYAITKGIVYLTSNKDIIEKEEEIEVTLYIENIKTAAFTAYLYFDNSKLEYVSGPENTNIIENCIIYVWYDESGGSDPKDGELAKFKFKTKEEGVATFSIDGEFYSNVGQVIQTNFRETKIQIGKEETKLENVTNTDNLELANTNLENLAIENVLLNPHFDSNITNYNIEVSSEIKNLNILAVPQNEKASIQIIGNGDFNDGNNLIKVIVTAQNGFSRKLYKINAYRRNIEEENKYLEEQQYNQEKLEEIYETEKTSLQLDQLAENNEKIFDELQEDKSNSEENENQNSNEIMLIILIICMLIFVVYFVIKQRKKKNC